MKLIILSTFIIVFPFSAPAQVQKPDVDSLQVTQFQKETVAYLTGIASELKARSSPKERKQTAKYLMKRFEHLGLKPSTHNYRMPNVNPFVDLIFNPYKGMNVYSILKSPLNNSDYVIIGAHYDSEPGTSGAIDNASGVAITLGLAMRLSQLPERNYNFIFVLFDQEEDDEVGSKAFVDFIRTQNININSVHIIDCIGWGDDSEAAFQVQSSDSLIKEQYYQTGVKLNQTLDFIGGRGSSDNKSFNEAGYPVAGFWDAELTPHIHKPTDTYSTINFERISNATLFLLDLLSQLEGANNEL